jgi:AraC family transcriptional regulator
VTIDLENVAARGFGGGTSENSMDAQQGPTYRLLREVGGLTLYSSHCGARPADRPFEEQLPAFSISLVERGVFTYRSVSGQAVLGPGWLMLGNQGNGYVCSHEFGDGHGDDCIVVGFRAETYEAVQEALGQVRGPFRRPALPPSPRVSALMKSLVASPREGFALEETALAVVAVAQTEATGILPAPPSSQRDRTVAAARYIESHAAEAVSLTAVAQEVGLSPFHFLRSFRRAIGLTPHQYLLRMRLIHAITLLRDTQLSITQVAYQSGWGDLSNFIRTFRRDIGCSPREFRRNGIPLRTTPLGTLVSSIPA